MEEAVRTLLQNPDSLDSPKVDPLDLMKAYKDKLLEEMWKQQDSLEAPPAAAAASQPPASPPQADVHTQADLSLGTAPQHPASGKAAENSALSLENDHQRRQYEHCLDEVANQVVQALLTQKDLKEECVKLRTRVFDLEQQNRILSVLFQQRVKMSTNTSSQLTATEVAFAVCSGAAGARGPEEVERLKERSGRGGAGEARLLLL
ncbi:unnamed protein product [Merluccius merluccius]